MKTRSMTLLALVLALGVSGVASAHEAGEWIVRAGIGNVDPKSDNLELGTFTVPVGLTIANTAVQVDSGASLTINGTYMFTDNWALDILGALPFSHDIAVSSSDLAGDLPLGETKHLPPTVSVQYHFTPEAAFQPYVGLGLNYTTFFDEEVTSEAVGVGVTDISLDDSFGLALQVGADFEINEQWLVNVDLRYIDIETDATLTTNDGTTVGSLDAGTVEIDPLVYSISIGYRF